MWRETCRVTFVTASVQSSLGHPASPVVTIRHDLLVAGLDDGSERAALRLASAA